MPCRAAQQGEQALVDETRRALFETLCRGTMWLDHLFGEARHPESASQVTGQAELSVFHDDEGSKVRGRMNVQITLPNLEHRVHAFFGREDRNDFISDRQQGVALRSTFLGLETTDNWLAGLGYSPPGTYEQAVDFRVGSRLNRSPEIFAQGRFRRNFQIGARNLWHVRETAFWTNRDGFGGTTGLDFDHVVSRTTLFRWGNVGTLSQKTHGLDWNSTLVLYHNLPGPQAIAGEAFIDGQTGDPVPLREYGGRAIYRHALGRNWLTGELVTGYSWVRREMIKPRQGMIIFGLGVELDFAKY